MDKRLKVQFEFINLYISIAYTEGRTDLSKTKLFKYKVHNIVSSF